MSKRMTTRQKSQAISNEYHHIQRSHDEVCTKEPKVEKRVGEEAVINCHFENGEMTCSDLSKRLPDNNIFAAEATVFTLTPDFHRHMDPVWHDVAVYTGSISCLQVVEGKDTENPPPWTSFGYWAIKVYKSVYAGYQAIVAFRQIKESTNWPKRPLPWNRLTDKFSRCRFEAISQYLYPVNGSNQVGVSLYGRDYFLLKTTLALWNSRT